MKSPKLKSIESRLLFLIKEAACLQQELTAIEEHILNKPLLQEWQENLTAFSSTLKFMLSAQFEQMTVVAQRESVSLELTAKENQFLEDLARSVNGLFGVVGSK